MKSFVEYLENDNNDIIKKLIKRINKLENRVEELSRELKSKSDSYDPTPRISKQVPRDGGLYK